MDMMLEDYRAACKIAGRLLSDVELKIVLDAHDNSPNLKCLRLFEFTQQKKTPKNHRGSQGHQLSESDSSVFTGMWVLGQIVEDIFGIKTSTLKNYRKHWQEEVHWKIGPIGKCVYSVDAINTWMQV